jgi:hypothetical protein
MPWNIGLEGKDFTIFYFLLFYLSSLLQLMIEDLSGKNLLPRRNPQS